MNIKRFGFAGLAIALAAAISLGGCGRSDTTPAPALEVYTNPAVSCPVQPDQLQSVLSGTFGVDAENRPVNEHGFPVNLQGQCLINAPVQNVYYSQPAPVYVSYLHMHYGYVWYAPIYRPLLTPGIGIYRTAPAIGMRVTTVPRYTAPAVTGVTINSGMSQTIRPNASGVNIGAGATQTLRPNAQPSTGLNTGATQTLRPNAQPTPATIAPTGGAQSQTFNRPQAPAASESIAPRGGTQSQMFNRPQTPSSSESIAPRGGFQSQTFNRPSAPASSGFAPRSFSSGGGMGSSFRRR